MSRVLGNDRVKKLRGGGFTQERSRSLSQQASAREREREREKRGSQPGPSADEKMPQEC